MFHRSESITMQLGGITDERSRRAAVQVLRSQKGIKTVSIDRFATACVTYRADQTTVDTITTALNQAGYSLI